MLKCNSCYIFFLLALLKGEIMNASRFSVSILSVSKAGNITGSDKYLIRSFDKKDNNSGKICCKLESNGTLLINGDNVVVLNNCSLNNIKDSVKKIVFENGIKGIGPEAFKNFANLKEIAVSPTVAYIDRGAFMNCESLSKVYFSNGIKSLGDNAFMSCSSLKSIIIPSGTTRIGARCFENCFNLREIVLPESVKIIDSLAFKNCSILKKVNLPDDITCVCEDIFTGCVLLNDNSDPGVNKDEAEDQVCNIDLSCKESFSNFTGDEEKISIFELSSLDQYILNNLNSKAYTKNKVKRTENIKNKYETIFSNKILSPVGINSRI